MRAIVLTAFLCAAPALTAFGAEKELPTDGLWKLNSPDYYESMRLNKDGSFDYEMVCHFCSPEKASGHWQREADTITLTFADPARKPAVLVKISRLGCSVLMKKEDFDPEERYIYPFAVYLREGRRCGSKFYDRGKGKDAEPCEE